MLKFEFKLTCKFSYACIVQLHHRVFYKTSFTDRFNNFDNMYQSFYVKSVHKTVQISAIPIFILQNHYHLTVRNKFRISENLF